MMEELLPKLIDVGGTVVTVGLFIWYLDKRNGKQERSMREIADTNQQVSERMERLQEAQETHTKVLIQVARNHGNYTDANALMEK